MNNTPIRIAVWASGNGSNFEVLAAHFKSHPKIEIILLATNKPDAYALERAHRLEIPSHCFSKADLNDGTVLKLHQAMQVDYIILAGFLWLMPAEIVAAYPQRIINIHPALLPKFGGKGMYGHRVHQAVISAGEKESGITIHFVDEHYDHGNSIFQARCQVASGDTPETLAAKIHTLEHRYFPDIVKDTIMKQEII